MITKGKYIIELAQLIPSRNINFYIDACRAMSAVNMQDILDFGEAEIRKLKSMVMDAGLQAKPKAAIEMLITHLKSADGVDVREGIKMLGKLMATNLREGEFKEKGGPFTKLPLTFISYAVVEDLMFHGQGPNYSFVGKFLDDLADHELIKPDFLGYATHTGDLIRTRCARYTHEDIAAIFLGYSYAHKGNLHPLVPFSNKPVGFMSALHHEVTKLLPCVEL
jgi:hypothetical protein